jgi:hypothetical protein
MGRLMGVPVPKIHHVAQIHHNVSNLRRSFLVESRGVVVSGDN